MICRKYLNILVLQSDISRIPPLYGWFETPLPGLRLDTNYIFGGRNGLVADIV